MTYVYTLSNVSIPTIEEGFLENCQTKTLYVGQNCEGSINGITIKHAQGTYGDIYYYYENGQMLIYGIGNMENGGSDGLPWESDLSSIKSIRFELGVTSIGSFALKS